MDTNAVNKAVERVLYDYMAIFIDEVGCPATAFSEHDAKYLAAKVMEAIEDAEVKLMEEYWLREGEMNVTRQYAD